MLLPGQCRAMTPLDASSSAAEQAGPEVLRIAAGLVIASVAAWLLVQTH